MPVYPEIDSSVDTLSYEPTPEDWAAIREDDGTSPPDEPRLPFVDLVRVQASYYRSLETDFGDWMAGHIDRLADQADYLEARSPAAFEDRLAAMLDAVHAKGGAL